MRQDAPARTGAGILILACCYFGTARLGLTLDAIGGFATLFWIPSGLSVSALFLGSMWLAPGVFIGAFLANWTNGAPPLVALGIGVGNMLEAMIGAYLLRRLDTETAFSRFKDILHLGLVAALAANVSAIIGVSSLMYGHVIAASAFAVTEQAWWIGDVLSIAVIVPFARALVTWLRAGLAKVGKRW